MEFLPGEWLGKIALLPTITVVLILRMGAIMSIGFEKTYLMQISLNLSCSEITSIFVY